MEQTGLQVFRLTVLVLLCGQFSAAWAVRPIYLDPPQQRQATVNAHVYTEVSGSGKVMALTSETVRVNGVLYLLSSKGVQVKAAEYPYREMELAKGMTIEFKGLKEAEDKDAMPTITQITVISR